MNISRLIPLTEGSDRTLLFEAQWELENKEINQAHATVQRPGNSDVAPHLGSGRTRSHLYLCCWLILLTNGIDDRNFVIRNVDSSEFMQAPQYTRDHILRSRLL